MNNNAWTRFFDTVFKYVLLNFLAFFSSLLGLFILGIFPALSALSITLPFYKEQTWRELSVNYWKNYKNNFIKANAYGWGLMILSIYLFFNTRICFQLTPLIFTFFGTLSLIILILVLSFGLNCFLFLEELNNKDDIKSLLFYTIYALPTSLLQITIIILFLILSPLYPAILLFGGVSLVVKANLYFGTRKIMKLRMRGLVK